MAVAAPMPAVSHVVPLGALNHKGGAAEGCALTCHPMFCGYSTRGKACRPPQPLDPIAEAAGAPTTVYARTEKLLCSSGREHFQPRHKEIKWTL